MRQKWVHKSKEENKASTGRTPRGRQVAGDKERQLPCLHRMLHNEILLGATCLPAVVL